jgi:hypothetical protein
MKNETNQAPTTYTFDERTISDLHKDVYGSRPGVLFWNQWKTVTDDQKQAIWDGLCTDLDQQLAQEEADHGNAITRFEDMVASSMAFGAQDRVDAIRWIEQAEGLNGSEYPPYEELEWQFGLPYGYVAESLA